MNGAAIINKWSCCRNKMSIIFIQNKTIQDPWSMSLCNINAIDGITFLGKGSCRYRLTVNEKVIEVAEDSDILHPFDTHPLHISKKSEIEIEITPFDQMQVDVMAFSIDFGLVNKELEKPDILLTDINHHPEQNVIIMLNFTKVTEKFRYIPDREIQIRNPDNTVYTVKHNSSLFEWRNERLYCKITPGERKVRLRFHPKHPWSDWMSFTCMSLKHYRRTQRGW